GSLTSGSRLMSQWLTELFGPLFAKEVIDFARRPRFFVIRALYCAALLGVFFLCWSSVGFKNGFASANVSMNTGARIAQSLCGWICFVMPASALALLPVLLAPSIVDDRRHHRLDLLRTTLLSDGEIILSKLASAVLGFLTILFCTAPFL